MSKYKYELYVSTRYISSEVAEEIDIVDDLDWTEEELDEMDDNQLSMVVWEAVEHFRDEEVEYGFKPLHGSRDV